MKKVRHIVIFDDDFERLKSGKKIHWSKKNLKTGKEDVDTELEYFPTIKDFVKKCEEKKVSKKVN